MRIFNLVDENECALHAGGSLWACRSNLNDTSIDIETVSLAAYNNGLFTFPPYNPVQIDAIKELALNILQRYPDITPVNVVGHSDIAPGRKSDPGAAFPWKELYAASIGAWFDEEIKHKYAEQNAETVWLQHFSFRYSIKPSLNCALPASDTSPGFSG